MKKFLIVFLTFFICTSSFSQVKPLKKKAALNKAVLQKNPQIVRADTLRNLQTKPAVLNMAKRLIEKNMISPSAEEVINTSSPTYKYSLMTGNKLGGTKTIILTLVKLSDDPNWIAEDNIILQEEVESNLNNTTTKKFSNLSLELNNAYAWNIEFKGENPDEENMDWNVFYYFEKGTIIDKEDPHLCNSKYIADPSFNFDKSSWNITNTSFNVNSNANIVSNGHDDSGAAVINSPNTIIYQRLQTPIRQNKSYQLKFSLKQEQEKTPFKIKAIAFNGSLNNLNPSPDVAIMTLSGTIPFNNDWSKITLTAWEAHKNFENIALVFISEPNPRNKNKLTLLIDRMCLTEVESACKENTISFETENPNGDDSITITHNEYLVGTVQDLYPNQDTSNANWYANIADDECQSIGGDDTDDDKILLNQQEEIERDEAIQELETISESLKANEPELFIPKAGITTIQQNEKDKKCQTTKPILNPSKPFGGRDIVYIHGLQLKAIIGNLQPTPTFQGKWPEDKHAFYKNGGNNPSMSNPSQNGEFYNEAMGHYWNNHIVRGLGSLTSPTNSYLIATYSANQRLDVSVHAVLTQIKEAMEGNNPNMVMASQNSNKCFGSNGIVVITHSTGGLVASTMFGIAERSHTNQRFKDYYGDVRFITDKIDAQIGFDAAYGGSPLAEIGNDVLANLTSKPLLRLAAKGFLGSDIDHLKALNPYETILYDLTPNVAIREWRPFMGSRIPTLTMTSSTIGTPYNSSETNPMMTIAGNYIIKGYDDGVLSSVSQANSINLFSRFKVKNRGKLVDKWNLEDKANGVIKASKQGQHFNLGTRNYFNTPYLSPTGMLQGNSVNTIIDPTNNHVPNHHIVLQTSGDHFDNVDLVNRYGDNGYLRTKRGSSYFSNKEETGIVFNPALYSTGLLNNNFKTLNQEWIKNEKWGFHAPKITMVRKCIRLFRKERCIKLPKISWHYYEYIKWQRKYHLLKDYETKLGMDYMYEYILR